MPRVTVRRRTGRTPLPALTYHLARREELDMLPALMELAIA